jgi:acyl carrier protein
MEMEERLKKVFKEALGIEEEIINDELKYNEIPQWDSVAHMNLVAEIESEFDIMLETDDIIDMSSFKKAKEIVSKYLG